MIILPNQGLGFLAIPHSAATAVESVLKQQKSVLTGGTPALQYLTWRDVEQFILPLLATQSVPRPHFFAVVSHPAARLQRAYEARNPATAQSLEDFVEQALSGPTDLVPSQSDFVTDSAGKVAVETLIRIEHLPTLLVDFLDRFNIRPETPPDLPAFGALPEGMPDALMQRIVASDRFGPDMDLYRQGIDTLPPGLPLGKRLMKKAQALTQDTAEEDAPPAEPVAVTPDVKAPGKKANKKAAKVKQGQDAE